MDRRMLRIVAIAGLVLLLSAGIASASQRVFPDVSIGHWAEKDLAEMKAKGIIAGYDDGYHPNENLSREQTIAMLLRVDVRVAMVTDGDDVREPVLVDVGKLKFCLP